MLVRTTTAVNRLVNSLTCRGALAILVFSNGFYDLEKSKCVITEAGSGGREAFFADPFSDLDAPVTTNLSKEEMSYKTLPENDGAMEALLVEKDGTWDLVWFDVSDPSPAFDMLRREIEGYPGDVHVVVGTNHEMEGHVEFINEMVTAGKDGKKLGHVTHVALEMFGADGRRPKNPHEALERWASEKDQAGNCAYDLYQHDMQWVLDLYQKSADSRALEFVEAYVKACASFRNKEAVAGNVDAVRAAPESEYIALAGDMSIWSIGKLEGLSPSAQYERREEFIASYVIGRLRTEERELVVYHIGLEHSEKRELPKYLRRADPAGKVVSIAMNGGASDETLSFDRALNRLSRTDRKWAERPFILRLCGYREADYVIHLPCGDRTISYEGGREHSAIMILRK